MWCLVYNQAFRNSFHVDATLQRPSKRNKKDTGWMQRSQIETTRVYVYVCLLVSILPSKKLYVCMYNSACVYLRYGVGDGACVPTL